MVTKLTDNGHNSNELIAVKLRFRLLYSFCVAVHLSSTVKQKINIALAGNPNSGKTSLFNQLTGLRQKVANYPGVTVEKKTGTCFLSDKVNAEITDLPGTYSLYPKSLDEFVAFDVLLNTQSDSYPDVVVVVADAANLKRNLLFVSQVLDLKLPTVVALNMLDVATNNGLTIDVKKLSAELSVTVIPINARAGQGIDELKRQIVNTQKASQDYFIDCASLHPELITAIKSENNIASDYAALLTAHHHMNIYCLDAPKKERTKALLAKFNFNAAKSQGAETLLRYDKINGVLSNCVISGQAPKELFSNKIDKVLTHTVFGYVIFIIIMFILFQTLFNVAALPMSWLDMGMIYLRNLVGGALPAGVFNDLICNGVLAGLEGILVFVPQIMLLFGMITVLEETGYMSRVSFMMDRLMKNVGMNGRSVVPLMSGMACAVPAIMSARTIQNPKDRLITILVTPLMSCSARLPVYTLLISLVVPDTKVLDLINLQGLVMLGMYFLGFAMALLVAFVLRIIIKARERSYFIMELPVYKMPRWGNVGLTMVEKAKIFCLDAGKVILLISVILWALASFGPNDRMIKVEEQKKHELSQVNADTVTTLNAYNADKLANSYAGILGKSIEPAIRPLGFDWKIGIALITSFAAREVFVGTMSTLYSVGENANNTSIKQKLLNAKNDKGLPVYSLATILSLMIFYAFAMQCMSTVAVVIRETGTWKIATIQIVYMTGLAYLSSFCVYHLLT